MATPSCASSGLLDGIVHVGDVARHRLAAAGDNKAVEGVTLGLLAFGTGGASLLVEGTGGVFLGAASTLSGAVATDLDATSCREGDQAACFGAVLGGAGALSSGGGLLATLDLFGPLSKTVLDTANAFGLPVGFAGVAFDTITGTGHR